MNWNAISAVSEAIGVFMVVITVAYLAVQIRYARLTAADANRQVRADGVREWLLTVAQNPELRARWVKIAGLEPAYAALGKAWNVSADEAIPIDMLATYWFWLHWGQFSSIKTQQDLAELEHLVSAYYAAPPVLESWRQSPLRGRDLMDPEFLDFVDKAIARSQARDA